MLNGLKANLPEKVLPVIVDSVKGISELPADNKMITNTNPNATTTEASAMQTATAPENNVAENIHANAAPAPTKKDKKAKDNDNGRANVEAKAFAEALATAIEKGKVKKGNRHIVLSFLEGDLASGKVMGVYDYLKPIIKSLIGCLKEVPGLTSAEEREETFNAWLESDKAHAKSFKKFNKFVGDEIKKFDNKLAMYLLTSEDNLKNVVSLVDFAQENPKKEDESPYSFMRENKGGIRGGWIAAGVAVVAGGIDIAQRGMSIGSLAGGAIGTAAAFGLGTLVDEHVEDNILRSGLAAGAGLLAGVGGTRLGRAVIPGDNFYEGSYSHVEDNAIEAAPTPKVIASQTPAAEASEGGMIQGLASYLMG